jgi:hypothetical protein
MDVLLEYINFQWKNGKRVRQKIIREKSKILKMQYKTKKTPNYLKNCLVMESVEKCIIYSQ